MLYSSRAREKVRRGTKLYALNWSLRREKKKDFNRSDKEAYLAIWVQFLHNYNSQMPPISIAQRVNNEKITLFDDIP